MTKKTLESKKLEQEARERLRTSPLRLQKKLTIDEIYYEALRIESLKVVDKIGKKYASPYSNSNTSAAN